MSFWNQRRTSEDVFCMEVTELQRERGKRLLLAQQMICTICFSPPRERWIVFFCLFFYFCEFLAHFDRSVLWYDSSYPPLFPRILFCSSDMFVSPGWRAFSSCASMRGSSIRLQMKSFFDNRLLGSGSVPRLHAVILRCSLIALKELPQPPDLDLSGSRGFHSTVTVL